MKNLTAWFDRVDVRVTQWMARYGILILRISLGLVFFPYMFSDLNILSNQIMRPNTIFFI